MAVRAQLLAPLLTRELRMRRLEELPLDAPLGEHVPGVGLVERVAVVDARRGDVARDDLLERDADRRR